MAARPRHIRSCRWQRVADRPCTLGVAAERQFLERLTGAGIPAGTAELLITREWAILAGENDYTTGTSQQITGRPPRPVAEFLHEHRAEFA
jgi:NAD(P)H dehydrogenase (quinone)